MEVVSPRQRFALRVCWYAAALLMAAYTVAVATNAAGAAVTEVFQDYVYNFLLFAGAGFCLWRAAAIRQERNAWLVLGLAIVSWTAADIVWTAVYTNDPNAPYPSIADALWLTWYPASLVVLVMLVRSRLSDARGSLWLDGLIGAVATVAIAAALAYGPVIHEGSAGDLSAAVLTGLAYPVGDLLLLGMVTAIFGLSSWRPGLAWIILGIGLVFNALGDGIYLVQTADGTWQEGSWVNALWPASSLLVGLAAWQRVELANAAKDHSLRVVIVPVICGVTAVGLLAYDHFVRLNGLTVVLAAVTLLLVLVRTALVFVENQRVLAHSRREALTDPLTGMRNRRSLMADLDSELPQATLERPVAVVLFDLDGFKEYNDAFGHPAGDGLLVRLGERLDDAVHGHGRAYRLGGDEFCAMLHPGAAGLDVLVDACVAALGEHGEGFDVTTSHGAVEAPVEVSDATEALQLADRRMYARKGDRRVSAGRQSRDVLLRSLSERQPDLHIHLRGTADLALAVGRELGMHSEELDDVAHAAELHDVGKIAIPDAILEKSGPLDETEWGFMRRHTIIGERILMAAPALRSVAKLVRSSHERWDGAGYPDGLVSEQIPLGARVVAVCDAFDAMTTNRPYRQRIGEPAALAELRRCAGTQFDPKVVEAFACVLEREMAAATEADSLRARPLAPAPPARSLSDPLSA
jgi:two-component system, cell cycle response regulator